MTFELPKLPYAYNALEPYIDEQTMTIHHTKHHQTYVNNLNAALEGQPEVASKSIEAILRMLDQLPDSIRAKVRNNGGGHANHSLFWELMTPGGSGEPTGELAAAINATFGSFATFKEQFAAAALNQFGSGWAWLVVDGTGKLAITSTPNQDNPISQGLIPLVGVDVWEHAYYLKYQNRRADYVAAWWNVVNWTKVGDLYTQAKG